MSESVLEGTPSAVPEPDRGELMAALAKANVELTNPTKDKTANAGAYGYKYASLDTILAHVRPVLAKHGLSIIQDVTLADGRAVVTTRLLHASGQSITFGPVTWASGPDIQKAGGAITYLRRYALTAALSVAADEDTDGAHAEKDRPAPVANPRNLNGPAARHMATEPMTDKQKQMLGRLVREQGWADSTEFIESEFVRDTLGGEPSKPLLKAHASALIDALMKRAEAQADIEEPPADLYEGVEP